MTCIKTAKADALRFITGFELKNGRCPSITEIADAQFAGDMMLASGVVTDLIAGGHVRHAWRSRDRKLQVVAPVPVPRAPDGEPLFFVRAGGLTTW